MKTLVDHIRKRRLDLGVMQKQAADLLGVDTASICNWEINKTEPMVHCLRGIIAFLGHNTLPEAGDLIRKFKRVRCSLGLTQEQLAQKLGIDESTIAGWERGENTPVGPYRKLLEDFLAADGSLAEHGTAKVRFSARKIIAPRKKLGLSKAALARQLGVNVNTLWRWERGERTPHGPHRTASTGPRQAHSDREFRGFPETGREWTGNGAVTLRHSMLLLLQPIKANPE